MPRNVELNVICVGSAEEARNAARRNAPSLLKFGQRCRTATVLFLVRLRLTERGGLRSTSISARVTLTCEQRDAICASGRSSPKRMLAAQSLTPLDDGVQ